MENDNPPGAIEHRRAEFLPALCDAIQLWAENSTSAGDRYKDLIRDKRSAVENFFRLSGKHPAEIKPRDVRGWREAMEAKGPHAEHRLRTDFEAVLLLPLGDEGPYPEPVNKDKSCATRPPQAPGSLPDWLDQISDR